MGLQGRGDGLLGYNFAVSSHVFFFLVKVLVRRPRGIFPRPSPPLSGGFSSQIHNLVFPSGLGVGPSGRV